MRAIGVAPPDWESALEVDRVLVDFDRRHRRRIRLTTEEGHDLLLDLPRPARLRDGDGLVLEQGGIVRVRAQPEALLEIAATEDATVARIAWHLGNRHLPVQLLDGRLRIRADHVIAEMVRLLGGAVTPLQAPFDPEPGAYSGGHRHASDDDGD